MPKKLSLEDFTKKARKVYGDRYDLTAVNFTTMNAKINLVCATHGPFTQRASHFLNGISCGKCGRDEGGKKRRLELAQFLAKIPESQKQKYDLLRVQYQSYENQITIVCRKHGEFPILPGDFIRGRGCRKCWYETYADNKRLDTEAFIQRARATHGDLYDYSQVVYIDYLTEVIIVCLQHGKFDKKPDYHIQGAGCPSCHASRGEEVIKRILDDNMLEYIRQKTFPKCKYKRLLKFDFYLPDLEVLIEFDGKQHDGAIEYFGGETALEETRKKDQIKDNFAAKTGRIMWRIKHNENIEERMEALFDFLQSRYEAATAN